MDNFECDEYLSSENWNVLECWWMICKCRIWVLPNTNSWWCCVQCYIRINPYVSLLVNYIRILHTDLSVCNNTRIYIQILHTDLSVCNSYLWQFYIWISVRILSVCKWVLYTDFVCYIRILAVCNLSFSCSDTSVKDQLSNLV